MDFYEWIIILINVTQLIPVTVCPSSACVMHFHQRLDLLAYYLRAAIWPFGVCYTVHRMLRVDKMDYMCVCSLNNYRQVLNLMTLMDTQ